MINDRTCFKCIHYGVCFAFKTISHAMQQVGANIDTDDTPRKMNDVWEAVGGSCLSYKERSNTDTNG